MCVRARTHARACACTSMYSITNNDNSQMLIVCAKGSSSVLCVLAMASSWPWHALCSSHTCGQFFTRRIMMQLSCQFPLRKGQGCKLKMEGLILKEIQSHQKSWGQRLFLFTEFDQTQPRLVKSLALYWSHLPFAGTTTPRLVSCITHH